MEAYLNTYEILETISHALDEDIKTGDITTNLLIPEEKTAKAFIKAKADGIVAGLPIAELVFKKLDKNLKWTPLKKDANKVNNGDILAKIEGSYRAILTGERLALNFMQRMSGIATETSKYVEAVKGTGTEILDTRKTVPGLRIIDKYSVKAGGGTNHRIGLFDLVMIKDNHIEVAGNITTAVENIRKDVPGDMKIEVETKNLEEVKEAVAAGADIIMLDNMSNEKMKECVEFIAGRTKVEASGNMLIDRIRSAAETGVDYISVGALTHSVKALDIGLYIEV